VQVPLAVNYLWLLPPEPPLLARPRLRAALARMAALRACAALQPGHPRFGPPSLCVRSLLDDVAGRLPLPPPGVRHNLPACRAA
jgi:hypothetical protein